MSAGAFHETHEAGTDAAPARSGLVSRSSRAAPGLRPVPLRGPARSCLTAGRLRPTRGAQERPPSWGRRERAGGGDDSGLWAKRGPAPEGIRTPPWSAAGRAPFRQRVPALRQSADSVGCATRRSIPSLYERDEEGRAKPGAPAKQHGRRSVGFSPPHPDEGALRPVSKSLPADLIRGMRWPRSWSLGLMLPAFARSASYGGRTGRADVRQRVGGRDARLRRAPQHGETGRGVGCAGLFEKRIFARRRVHFTPLVPAKAGTQGPLAMSRRTGFPLARE
jgi:hypothetical protein